MSNETTALQPREDDDDISITSSRSEEYPFDAEFEVERVLAEKMEHGRRQYLILWGGYPEEKSTWEPKNHLTDATLDDWKERKKLEQEGSEEPFDLIRFGATLDRIAEQKAQRHRRRRAKRKRLKIPVSPSSSTNGEASDSDSNIEAVEVTKIPDAHVMNSGPKTRKQSSAIKKKRRLSKESATDGIVRSDIQQLTEIASEIAPEIASTAQSETAQKTVLPQVIESQKESKLTGQVTTRRKSITGKEPQACYTHFK
jgi:chromo domain-containing protein 1